MNEGGKGIFLVFTLQSLRNVNISGSKYPMIVIIDILFIKIKKPTEGGLMHYDTIIQRRLNQ
jgi:hypothetical protein